MKKLLLVAGLCFTGLSQADSRPLPPIIDHSSYAQQAAYSNQGTANQATLGMLNQITSLQTEIQQLRGLVEQQKHELSNLKKRQQSIYADMNSRFQKLSPVGVIAPSDVLTEGDLAVPVADRRSVVPAASFVKQAAPTKKVALSEKVAFDAAYANVRNNHYKEAIVQFKQFLSDFPTGEYSDNAQFWLASVYKVTHDIKAAKAGFKAVATNYPQSDKASVALYKLADIYRDENNKPEAKKLYQQLTKQYAGSTSAKMALKKLREMDI
ncbi:MAG: tol-pal system protein YbgF [Methyloprofundus sp.]|nr:tol-pal system protein YbgF [Methyloprofundus sp.]